MAFSMAEALYLRGWVPPQKGPIRVLDLGSGTGASGLSCLQILRNAGIENHIQLEASITQVKVWLFLRSSMLRNLLIGRTQEYRQKS